MKLIKRKAKRGSLSLRIFQQFWNFLFPYKMGNIKKNLIISDIPIITLVTRMIVSGDLRGEEKVLPNLAKMQIDFHVACCMWQANGENAPEVRTKKAKKKSCLLKKQRGRER